MDAYLLGGLTMKHRIIFSDVTITFDQHPAVHHISGEFDSSKLNAIIGPNGAGKSTILKAIAGLIDINSGEINLGKASKKDIAYLPQISEIDRSFPISVMDFVLFGSYRSIGIFNKIGNQILEKAEIAIEAVGLRGFKNRQISSLSAGQFQRVQFARILMQDSSIILLDEPFNAIDTKTTADLLSMLQKWENEDRLVIAILHDNKQVQDYFQNILLLARKSVAWGTPEEVLSGYNLMEARRMMEAWKEDASYCSAS